MPEATPALAPKACSTVEGNLDVGGVCCRESSQAAFFAVGRSLASLSRDPHSLRILLGGGVSTSMLRLCRANSGGIICCTASKMVWSCGH